MKNFQRESSLPFIMIGGRGGEALKQGLGESFAHSELIS